MPMPDGGHQAVAGGRADDHVPEAEGHSHHQDERAGALGAQQEPQAVEVRDRLARGVARRLVPVQERVEAHDAVGDDDAEVGAELPGETLHVGLEVVHQRDQLPGLPLQRLADLLQ